MVRGNETDGSSDGSRMGAVSAVARECASRNSRVRQCPRMGGFLSNWCFYDAVACCAHKSYKDPARMASFLWRPRYVHSLVDLPAIRVHQIWVPWFRLVYSTSCLRGRPAPLGLASPGAVLDTRRVDDRHAAVEGGSARGARTMRRHGEVGAPRSQALSRDTARDRRSSAQGSRASADSPRGQ